MSEPRWHWRNCRDAGFSLRFFPLSWCFGFERNADVYGGDWSLRFGPFDFVLHANIGNCASPNRVFAWISLSEAEAYERAVRFEARETVTASPSQEGGDV